MTVYCGFCGKSQHEVTKLVAGPAVYICDECVGLCHDIVQGRELRRPPPRENEPGSFGCHEVLHLAAVFAAMVRRHLLDHWAIRRKPAWAELAEKVVEALNELHQAIGTEHLSERADKL